MTAAFSNMFHGERIRQEYKLTIANYVGMVYCEPSSVDEPGYNDTFRLYHLTSSSVFQ